MNINKKTSIIFFSHSSFTGGAELSLADLIGGMCKLGVTCSVIVPSNGPLVDLLKLKGAIVYVISPGYSWWAFDKMVKDEQANFLIWSSMKILDNEMLPIVRKINPDFIYSQTIVCPWGVICANKLNVPHVLSVREYGVLDHDLSFHFGFKKSVNALYNDSDIIFSNTDDVKKVVFNDFVNDSNFDSKCITVGSSINISEKIIKLAEETPFVGLSKKEQTNILVLGSICEGKGQIDVVRAIIELKKKGYNIHLTLMGYTNLDYIELVKKEIRENNIQDIVDIKGFNESGHKEIINNDILISSSKMEALGRVLLESALLGRPFIYSNTGGSKEVFINKLHGLAYEPGNYNQLVDKIIETIEKGEETHSRIKNAKKYVKETFNDKNYIEKQKEVLANFIKDAKNRKKENTVKLLNDINYMSLSNYLDKYLNDTKAELVKSNQIINEKDQKIFDVILMHGLKEQEVIIQKEYITKLNIELEKQKEVIGQKNKELCRSESMIELVNNKLNSSTKLVEITKKELDDTRVELDRWRAELSRIYFCRGWKVVILARRIIEMIIPRSSFRRKITGYIFGLLKIIAKIIINSVKIIKRDGLIFFIKICISRLNIFKFVKKYFKRFFSKTNKIHTSNLTIACSNSLKKIIYVGHDANFAGAEVLTLNILKELKENFGFTIYLLLKSGGVLQEEYKKYATIFNLAESFETRDKKVELIKLLKSHKINHAITNTVVSGDITELLHNEGIRTVSLIHEMSSSIDKHGWIDFARTLAQNADNVVFASKIVKDEFNKVAILPDEKVRIRPQGLYQGNIYKNNKESARKMLRKKLGFSDDSTIVLGVAAFSDHRKGIDLFVDVANKVKNSEIKFVWVGDIAPEMQKIVSQKVRNCKNVTFVKTTQEVPLYYAGSDMYLMTSREDPFPSTVMEAMAVGVPVIGFQGAGGFVDIVTSETGVIVPYLDTSLMADAVKKLAKNSKKKDTLGRASIKLIETQLVFRDYISYLLDLLGFGNKKISVIIPNYNYEKYLKERLESIINQTYKPHEIIFLDDNSKDNSVSLAKKILSKTTIPYRIIKNDINAGCFRQWVKGIQLATGDLIWIAEADDSSDSNFLDNLVPKFYNQEVVISYCQSKQIDENNRKLKDNYLYYTDDISKEKWLNDYINNGVEEIANAMCIKNTIPNVSAVLFKKTNFNTEVLTKLYEFKASGDWYFYLTLLKKGDIAYCSKNLNFHRRHTKSITGHHGTQQRYQELVSIQNHIMGNYDVPDDSKQKMFNYRELVYKCDILDSGEKGVLNICFSCDNNYVAPLSALIASILKNSSNNDVYNFYILDGGINEENKEKINKIKSIRDFNICFVPVNSKEFNNCPITDYAPYITIATYYRFKIPSFFPKIDKILYMDCDMIVNRNIKELYDTNIDDYYVAAVPEVCNQFHKKRLGLDGNSYYFNAGLLLINNKKWRDDNIEQKLFQYAMKPEQEMIHQDQDILNIVLKNKKTYLPIAWNLQHDAIDMEESYIYHNLERLAAIKQPHIIHYTNKFKPWHKECTNKFKNMYFEYVKLTPFDSVW
ncbi:MAG: glycosyltransferase [Minisyncoccia bacterium]